MEIDPSGLFGTEPVTIDGPGDAYLWFIIGGGTGAFFSQGIEDYLKGSAAFSAYLNSELAFATKTALGKFNCATGGTNIAVNDKKWVLTSTNTGLFSHPVLFDAIGHNVDYMFFSTVTLSTAGFIPFTCCCIVLVDINWTVAVKKWYTFSNKGPAGWIYGSKPYWIAGQIDGDFQTVELMC